MITYGIALGGPYVCRGCGVHHVHASPCEIPDLGEFADHPDGRYALDLEPPEGQ